MRTICDGEIVSDLVPYKKEPPIGYNWTTRFVIKRDEDMDTVAFKERLDNWLQSTGMTLTDETQALIRVTPENDFEIFLVKDDTNEALK